MRAPFLFLAAGLLFSQYNYAQQDYLKIHQKAVFADSHNDILTACIEKKLSMDADLTGKTHSDLARFKKAGVDVQIFSVWCDGNEPNPLGLANREMDSLDAVVKRNPDAITIVHSQKELKAALKAKKLAAMFGVEGGHMMNNDLENLNRFYARGTRYMTLTWNNSNPWATSAMDETLKKDSLARTHKGLTDFGKQVVQRMNELGMMIDLSHVGEQTFWDVINSTTKPVIVSHSNAYSLCPIFRNLKDDQIKAVAKNGGVIDLNFYSGFIDSTFKKKEAKFVLAHAKELDALKKQGMVQEYALSVLADKYADEVKSNRPPLSAIMDHMDYIVKLAGIDHVGIGSDFDGITSSPQDLDGVLDYPNLTKAMLERGYSKKDINKVLGGNLLRVLKANENK
ncbi:MAG: dipeptidase [Bacteroidetes bacterium 24-39-8]|jgi:membrane dipeptidase|nr:MAG: dipeptidase [Bacteroidetes bacterium 24-39-8]OZA64264.1 MAG: dipeptidase [Sphingobacteriia bacterium 39-39-8]HQR93483.1 dipeptidase [Sediminibacterium sp.]HQS54907.1 dipeptidase [Sediminibacterium sp.]